MRQYKVFEHPDGRIRYVKQGWLWPGFFFTWAWALSKRMWGIATIMFMVPFVIGFAFSAMDIYFAGAYGRDQGKEKSATSTLIIIVSIVSFICVGLNGNAWRERNLKSRGYAHKTIIDASNSEGARALYIKKKQAQANSDFLSPLSNSSMFTQITESKKVEECVLKANKYLHQGNYEKTFEAITKATELDPNCFRAYNIRGIAYYKMENYSRALEDFNNATNLDPKDSRPYFNRALVYEKLQDQKQTIKELKEAARMGNQNSQEWLKKKGEKWE